mgnify:CR=1 FL=1
MDVGYRLDGDHPADADRVARFEWRVIEPSTALEAEDLIGTRTRRAINVTGEAARRARKLLFATKLWEDDQAQVGATAKADDWMATNFADAISARTLRTVHGTFGYLRLWTFDVDHAGKFVDEVADVLRRMPRKGLIIDLRSNPGGVIDTAERLFQLFATNRIEPTRFACRATRAMAEIAAWERDTGRGHVDSIPDAMQRLAEARAAVAALMVTDVSAVALTHSTTDGMNAAALLPDWRAGGRAVTSTPANINMMANSRSQVCWWTKLKSP